MSYFGWEQLQPSMGSSSGPVAGSELSEAGRDGRGAHTVRAVESRKISRHAASLPVSIGTVADNGERSTPITSPSGWS